MCTRAIRVAGVLWAALASSLVAQSTPATPVVERSPRVAPVEPIDARTREAILRGLEFLFKSQTRSGVIGEKYPVAVTSLAGLGLLGSGYGTHGGRYSEQLDGCVSYIVESEQRGGYLSESVESSKSRMHGHCLALLLLTQVYGELPRASQARVRPIIHRAIRCVERAQSRRGGWWYGPSNVKQEDEASVTIGALQSLRAARNIGFHVEDYVIAGARRYVRDCQVASGAIRYSLSGMGQGNRTTFSLTAAAIATLHSSGVYNSKVIQRGFDFMERELAKAKYAPRKVIEDSFFYYGALYATQAYFQQGGKAWERWRDSMREYLLKKQRADGSWKDSANGDDFATAVAVLILEIPILYLPIFER